MQKLSDICASLQSSLYVQRTDNIKRAFFNTEFRTINLNRVKTIKRRNTLYIIQLLMIAILVSACTVTPQPIVDNTPPPPPKPVLSSKPIDRVSEVDIKYAQSALNQLGYKLGAVDGIWGPRSARAIREFELANNIQTAGGRLSELNLTKLSQATSITRQQILSQEQAEKKQGITAKLDKNIPFSQAPQLIITDKPYSLLAKANPYSEVVAQLEPGTGIYVIGLQEGWYEIESLTRQRGFIRE